MRVSCDQGTIDIKAYDGKSIFVRFSSFRAAFAILKVLRGRDDFASVLKSLERALKQMDVTLFWRSSRLGILGSKGNPSLVVVLLVIQRISKLIL